MSSSAPSFHATKPWEPDQPDVPTVLERYRILGTIGKGGMGIVFKGFHLSLERHVAIKTLRIDRIGRPELVNRFRQEIKLVGQMDHDNVVRATDAGEKNGVFYLVMEFLSGCDLDKLVVSNGPLKTADACELVRQAALGLEYIHQKLVHRDIKPSNLMLTSAGLVKILDLGLAHCDPDGTDEHEETPAGYAVGTRAYMAPEQAQASRAIDGRADIYSLGCTLFKLLAGSTPFSGKEHEGSTRQMYAHCHVPLTAAPAYASIPDELRPILLRMLAKHPDDRYESARAVAVALAPFVSGGDTAHLLSVSGETDEVQPLTSPLPQELSRLTDAVIDTQRDAPTVSTSTRVRQRPTMRQKRNIWVAACVALVGLGLALWLVIALALHGRSPEDGLQSIDQSPTHKIVELLKRRPVPIGFGFDDPRGGAWNRDGERLDVPPGKLDRFFLLGATKGTHFEFEAVVEQSPWTGYVGVFWGYHEDLEVKGKKTPNVPFAWFQCVHILHALGEGGENRYAAARNKGTLHYSQAGNVASRLVPPPLGHDVKNLAGKTRLKIAVAANRLVLVEVGGERMADLYSDNAKANDAFLTDAYQGGIGLLTLGTAATFSDVRFVLNSEN